MSDIILSDKRVEFPRIPLFGTTINSDLIPKAAGANRVIVELLPRWLFSTHIESKTSAPTEAGTWFSPTVETTRKVGFSVHVGGSPVFDSGEQTFQENLTVGYIGQSTAIIDHADSFLPKPMMPTGVDGPKPIQGYLHGFNLGDGSGVVEALRAHGLRMAMHLALHAVGHTTGTLTQYDDGVDGSYRITVWGTPA